MLFGRNAQVVVGDDKEAIKIPAEFSQNQIKIEFSIRKTFTGKHPKDNYISVYNLSDATQSFITKRAQRIRLYAGYGTDLPIIFDGQITTIDNGRYRLESILKMTLGDSIYNINDAFFSQSYRGAVDVKTIINDAVTSFGISAVGISDIPTKQLNNFAFHGQTKTLFTKLLDPMGIDWYSENGIIRFSKRGKARSDIGTVLLSEDTGMIESPRKTDKGIRVTSLLNNNLILGGLVKIESSTLTRGGNGRTANQLSYSADGVYKINEITHMGNNIDDRMVTEILAVSL